MEQGVAFVAKTTTTLLNYFPVKILQRKFDLPPQVNIEILKRNVIDKGELQGLQCLQGGRSTAPVINPVKTMIDINHAAITLI